VVVISELIVDSLPVVETEVKEEELSEESDVQAEVAATVAQAKMAAIARPTCAGNLVRAVMHAAYDAIADQSLK